MTVPLPDLYQATLDEPGLRTLFADLEACAEVLDVQAKGAGEGHSFELKQTAASALEALLSRRVAALQVRYRHGGEEWRDTVLATSGAFRLVRMRMKDPGSYEES